MQTLLSEWYLAAVVLQGVAAHAARDNRRPSPIPDRGHIPMDIVIKNLPAHVDDAEVQGLLKPMAEVSHIQFFQPDHPDHGSCVVFLASGRETAYRIAERLNGQFWRGHELFAYVPLYGQRPIHE